MTDREPPTPVSHLLKLLYWRVYRHPRFTPHVVAMLLRFCRKYLTLTLRKYIWRARPPTMAISLIEHLGDIVAAEPIARAARLRFPRHRIHWIMKPAYAELAAAYPPVDQVITVRCLTESMLLQATGIVDEVWDLHIHGRVCERCWVPLTKPVSEFDSTTYFRFGNLLTIQCLSAGIPPLPGPSRLSVSLNAVARVDALGLPERFVAIHCISNEAIKNWPVSSWLRLVAAITRDLFVEVIEVGLRSLVIEQDGERVRSLCGQLSIMETAEVIRRAALFVGIDSGPAHLANAVGTPGVILLGTYLGLDDRMPFSGGYQDGSTADLLRVVGAMQDLPVDTAFAAVAGRLREARVVMSSEDPGRPLCGTS